MDALEENDDVQDVYANFDIPERVLEDGRYVDNWQGGFPNPSCTFLPIWQMCA